MAVDPDALWTPGGPAAASERQRAELVSDSLVDTTGEKFPLVVAAVPRDTFDV